MSCETAVKVFKKFIALENCRASVCVEFNGGSDQLVRLFQNLMPSGAEAAISQWVREYHMEPDKVEKG